MSEVSRTCHAGQKLASWDGISGSSALKGSAAHCRFESQPLIWLEQQQGSLEGGWLEAVSGCAFPLHWQPCSFVGNLLKLQHLALQRYPLESALSLWEEPLLPGQSLTRPCTDIRLRLCDRIQYNHCGMASLQFCWWRRQAARPGRDDTSQ